MTICEPSSIPQVHSALLGRFSPVGFDSEAKVSDRQVDTLLDAARHAHSAGNSQPWRFIVGRRGDAIHRRVLPLLARSSSLWAPSASLLVVNLAHIAVEGSAGLEYSEFARYDVGQAVAHMTIQALHLGLDAHQFRAFDRAGLAAEFHVPSHWEMTSMTAFGVSSHSIGEAESAGRAANETDVPRSPGRVGDPITVRSPLGDARLCCDLLGHTCFQQ
jgi:hypothetical protein